MTRKRALVLAAVWTGPSLFFLAIVSIVYFAFRIEVPARADTNTRVDAMAVMRAALEGAPAPAMSPHLRIALDNQGPIIAVVYLDGLEVARAVGYGATWHAALTAAAAELVKAKFMERDAETRARARIRIDAVVGRGPFPGEHLLFDTFAVGGVTSLFAINPGLEGLGATVDGKEMILVPHDLIAAPEKPLQKVRPFKVAQDVTMGVDLKKIDGMLVRLAGAKPLEAKIRDHFRLRVDSFAERAQADRAQPPVPLYRDMPARPPLSSKALREAALEGGRYLVAHLGPNGRYVYNHNLNTGVTSDPMRPGEYSIPRHAGTTYFMAELYRLTKEEWLREPIERAFNHLQDLVNAGACHGTTPSGEAFSCVADRGATTADLGSTALGVVALAEYQRATNDTRYLDLATKLTNWLMYMQRPDGTFRYYMNIKTKVVDEKKWAMYYAGEAALAFARMGVVTGDPKYGQAAGRALDKLVHAYDFFLGGFFYGEEHWTCIASEAVFPAVKNDKYRTFCNGYGAFLRQQQAAVGDYPDEDDLAGAYNQPPTPFVMPWNTPAGSRTEAMISAYLLGHHHGKPEPEIRAQIMAALHYTLGQMITPEGDISSAGSLRVHGAMPGSPIDRVVRIDYVQHVCSAMIRAAAMMDEGK